MTKIIVANWKMNIVPSKAAKIVKELDKIETENRIVILAPYIDLPYMRSNKIEIGAQNIHYKDNGSYTGEISPLMLKDININYAMVGHYERRNDFHETDSIINLKVRNAVSNNLHTILCVSDIDSLIKDLVGVKDYSKLIVAYEPKDYIGGFDIAPVDEIREFITRTKKLTNNNALVIYGGGINVKNIDDIRKIDELDGILVGNSSIRIDNFKQIIKMY